MNITAEEKLMYSVMKAIYDSGIPISFKGSMVMKAYLMEAGCFQGTASELMDRIPEIDLVPNQLTRQLNIKAGRLYEDYGIRYDNKRCHDGRIITLEYEKE